MALTSDNASNPAHPLTYRIDSISGEQTLVYPGLTKREYFAAMAFQGLFASSPGNEFPNVIACAQKAVQAADALLLEIEK